MDPDSKLLLDELYRRFVDGLSKRFYEQNAKWDQGCTSRDGTHPTQVAGGQMILTARTTASPPTTSSASTATFGDTTVVNPGSEHTTAQQILSRDATTCNVPTRCLMLVPTTSPTPVNTTGTTSPTTINATTSGTTSVNLAASTFIPAPAAEETLTSPPTKCSTQCLSRDIEVLKSVDTLTIIWTATPTLLHFTTDILLGINKDIQKRNLATTYTC